MASSRPPLQGLDIELAGDGTLNLREQGKGREGEDMTSKVRGSRFEVPSHRIASHPSSIHHPSIHTPTDRPTLTILSPSPSTPLASLFFIYRQYSGTSANPTVIILLLLRVFCISLAVDSFLFLLVQRSILLFSIFPCFFSPATLLHTLNSKGGLPRSLLAEPHLRSYAIPHLHV
ncbi:hypothetical protein VTL71DRAFT_11464 [Oculimacula yallundae]|uniref:Transmembrane protein n=1 Tax=Oculimacula yallundae TaxID=86028 RepID=A0ABR4CSF4_9HELO